MVGTDSGQARWTVVAALLLVVWSNAASAQRVAVEVLADLEAWKTDSGSTLLARNRGEALVLGRLSGWALLALGPRLEISVFTLAQAGSDGARNADVEELVLRFREARTHAIEVGRMLHPVGGFARRRFSHVNPLVGFPDAYPPVYPWGAQLVGRFGTLDYRLAGVAGPAVNEEYVPPPGDAIQPAGAIGFSAGPSLRVGASMTGGAYLPDAVQPHLPAGTRPRDYRYVLVGIEARWSMGYVEAHAEYLHSRYDVPTIPRPVHGNGGYLEVRATVSPRVFLAARGEINDYAFILPVSRNFWVGTARVVRDAEIGAGYRLGPATLVKASYRRDSWPDPDPPGLSFPDGYSFAVQLSHRQDLLGLFARRY